MNGTACTVQSPCHVEGSVDNVTLSGRGPASGHLIVTVRTDNASQINLVASVMTKDRKETQVEDVVFVGFTTMATTARLLGRRVRASYWDDDTGTHRLNNLTFLPGDA